MNEATEQRQLFQLYERERRAHLQAGRSWDAERALRDGSRAIGRALYYERVARGVAEEVVDER